MSAVVELGTERPVLRRRDAATTKSAILAAAKAQFARFGYEGAALREIALAAGADAALVQRYFGGKQGLFAAALRDSIRPERLSGWDRAHFGRDIALMMAGHAHEDSERTQAFQFLLRAATSPVTAPLLSAAVQERFLGPIRAWLGGAEAAVRARLLAATFIGLLVERLIRDEPLAGAERDVFIERAANLLQALADDR